MRKRTFYRRWLSMAFWHSFGVADGLSTALGMLVPLIARLDPRWTSAMTDLIWQLPLTAMSTLIAARLVLAPYWLHNQQEQEALERDKELNKQIARQKLQLDTRSEQLKERLRRRAICEGLVGLSKDGDQILRWHIEHKVAHPELVDHWEIEVSDFLADNLNQVYLARFSGESGMMVYPGTATNSTRPLLNRVYTRLERLRHFMEELCAEIDS